MVSQFCAKFFMIEDKWNIADLSGERLVNYVQKFREKAFDCAETMAKKDLVKMCIKGLLDEYRLHTENQAIYNFVELIAKSRNTEATVCRLAKPSNQNNQNWPWKGSKRGCYSEISLT
uniref:Retrotransposon gag domain-containing protein n=1 Tax=Cannabis sativa TaxID=3483 RepID=A0A803QFA1_CANSA